MYQNNRIRQREEQDKSMRIIGLDYGTKTVGVAVSDALMITAQPLETIERKSANKLRQTLARIESIIEVLFEDYIKNNLIK